MANRGVAQRVAKRLLRRKPLDDALDRARFHLDTFPRNGRLRSLSCVGYQPLPWVGLNGSRERGSWTRWAAIEAELNRNGEAKTALDLGCNIGFFTLSLAQRGLTTVGVENNPVSYRTALYAIKRAGLHDAGILMLDLGPETVGVLPEADVVLFLSLWHHLVHANGVDGATAFLREIWRRTRGTLFFDTGEREMPAAWGLPAFEPDPRTWLEAYLADTCEGGEVRHLGLHEAFDLEGRAVERNLFAVHRAA